MSGVTCQQVLDGVGSGVAASLRAVDCMANTTAQAAFGRLFGHGGALLPALTILLTLYIAFFAFSLITGRTRLGISALTPRMVTLGVVLTFATSWVAYQGVIWNLAVGAPDQIASLLMGTNGSSTEVFADKIDTVFGVLSQLSSDPAPQAAQSAFSPSGLLWMGATLLLLGTIGILATCKIALAVLLALGPVFTVMALFEGTRGLFTGWVKGVVMLAIAPLFAVVGGSLMLELAVPVLSSLGQSPGAIAPEQAMAFFMIGAIHVALMVMVMKVSATMVSGWTVFGLSNSEKAGRKSAGPAGSSVLVPAVDTSVVRGSATSSRFPERRIRTQTTPLSAANDHGGVNERTRGARIVAAPDHREGSPMSGSPGLSRAQGVGSRFRAANSGLPRNLEKLK